MREEIESEQEGPVMAEMKTWEKSDLNWPEVKEFYAKLAEVVKESRDQKEKSVIFHRPVPTPATYTMDEQKKALIAWYLKQDLRDDLPRSQQEIDAIRATIPGARLFVRTSAHRKAGNLNRPNQKGNG
jgi:hypothetical protein